MKIKRLRLAGFGPFKTEQTVNFEAFDADGIFLITGKTGAGKSSILDAICFALYGQVPRFTGSEQQLRSDHCAASDPTYVELDFSISDTDYRLLRSPQYERAKKSGIGMTTAAPTAVLQVRDADGWRGVAAKPGTVGHELATILPLKQDQFLQVILLAQNRFQRFLLAKTDERREVLRTLCGSSRFDQLETALILRRKALDDELGTVQRAIEDQATAAAHQLRLVDTVPTPDLAWFTAALAGIQRDLGQAVSDLADSTTALSAAAAQDEAVAETERRQARRAGAAAKLLVLAGQRSATTELRAVVTRANRAARVWPQIRGLRAATTGVTIAQANEVEARTAWRELRAARGQAGAIAGIKVEPDDERTLTTTIDELLGRMGALGAALTDEKQLPALTSEVMALGRALATSTAALNAAQERLDALPAEIDELVAQHSSLAVLAAGEKEAEAKRARLSVALAAAEDVVLCERESTEAQNALRESSRENMAAAAAYDVLLARRFAGHAQELAGQLSDGIPCLVCGSPVHPAPASADAQPVNELDLDEARMIMLDRQASLAAAQGVVNEALARLFEVRAISSHRGVDDLQLALAQADEQVHIIREAVKTDERVAQELAERREQLVHAHSGLVAVRSERDAVATTHGDRSANLDVLRTRVAEHHDGFDSISAQMSHLQQELDAARALSDARAVSRERQTACADAAATLQAEIIREDFTDESDVVGAHLDDAQIQAAERNVRDYDDALAAAQAAADDPELVGVPSEAVDRLFSARAREEAGIVRDDAVMVHSSLVERCGQLARIVAEVTTRFAASADLLERHSQVRQLAAVVHGDEPNTKRMRLETYVLAAELEQIVEAANTRLRTMTSGRYTLEHDDSAEYRGGQSGLGLAIRDEHTGRARATHSLSGGETFLASLALALGLAEVVTGQAGGVTLDTLFVDEGFGSLDAETLETAMGALDALRAGGRTVGLISHVESMKEQIPATLNVIVSDSGPSMIRQID
ncbi:SMC family ATPase [Cryobacterium sp. CG_9.6]|uniref:SMC family ATPase n=1 Tax=Cryobacterium sp. CG_9.6 TaxID=2760710 RepID=UPI002474BFDF|nr:SMC family ATPase [Cryobacterium sp. CG_9.6]MDH6237667.1 exonuclease SbcC [Cryobacterium sp. CG_9.6]